MKCLPGSHPPLVRWGKSMSAMGIGKNGFGVEKEYAQFYAVQGVQQNRTRRNAR